MSTIEQPLTQSKPAVAVSGRWLAVVYAATILVSAFLLFQVQPVISKAILPWFGGSPAVWTTCMLFFQTLLFAGYLYAHLSEHYLKPAARLWVHLGLLGGALITLPIAPSAAWKPTGAEDPAWRILILLGVSVGLPYLVLSSTGPLVQAWFSRTFPGRSPYRLYSLSNVGSLAALLSYPFLVEPSLSLGVQTRLWSMGFAVFAVLAAVGAAAVRRETRREQATTTALSSETAETAEKPLWLHRVLWVFLPAFASMALLATTNYVCQDVAVIPFLWVIPLSLYLLSFIICFDHERWYWRPVYASATAALAIVLAGWADVDQLLRPLEPVFQWALPAAWNPLPLETNYIHELVICFSVLFGVCMVCHGELVRLKPHPRYLTSFYLWIAAGGALGGMFVSLLAPAVFDSYVEWDISLLGGYVIAFFAMLAPHATSWRGKDLIYLVPMTAAGMLGFAALLHVREADSSPSLMKSRSFYGEVTVVEHNAGDPEFHDRTLLNGTIIHGAQFVPKEYSNLPTTYYSPDSGVGQVLLSMSEGPERRVGAVGLGTGTLAVYAEPGDVYRFYEINPEVPELARTWFSYLDDCRGETEIVLGDARLSMEREAAQNYDALVLDAFSGDAIPVHLLTREAFHTYLRHLKPDGVICVHISNSYLDLQPVVRGIAKEFGLEAAIVEAPGDDDLLHYNSDWMLLSRSPEPLASVETDPLDETRPALLWTDDYSNLFEILQ